MFSGSKKNCVIYVKGKQNRSQFKEVGKRTENVFDLIHTDVMGPINVSSFSGSRYILTFVDDYSHKVFAVLIKQKSEVLGAFKKFKEFAEKQCGRKIKVLRSNNGTEYVNNHFKEFIEKNWYFTSKKLNKTVLQNV